MIVLIPELKSYQINLKYIPKSPDGQSQSFSPWYGGSKVSIRSLDERSNMVNQLIKAFWSHATGTVELLWSVS